MVQSLSSCRTRGEDIASRRGASIGNRGWSVSQRRRLSLPTSGSTERSKAGISRWPSTGGSAIAVAHRDAERRIRGDYVSGCRGLLMPGTLGGAYRGCSRNGVKQGANGLI
jgi:hypothetical protein